MRSQVMHNLVRKIKFEGHVGAYVADLAMVYFTGIKHTADWFLASFKENEVASAFIDWARRQVENYTEIFRNQVYTGDVETKVIEEAMRITYSLSKKLLEEYGLDFRFLLDEQLIEKPKETPKPVTTSYTAAAYIASEITDFFLCVVSQYQQLKPNHRHESHGKSYANSDVVDFVSRNLRQCTITVQRYTEKRVILEVPATSTQCCGASPTYVRFYDLAVLFARAIVTSA
ncbi:hypothetical protein MPER_09206 [Moniliophthora perniciosa FA553]|nr:hypothetical protein MPER_09206 [Moniliophthora perniciosa FA553]